MKTLHAYAVTRDCSVVSQSDLDPKAAAILRRLSQVKYVLEQHRIAVARHSQDLAELHAQLRRMGAQP
jgi:hypothetical protein